VEKCIAEIGINIVERRSGHAINRIGPKCRKPDRYHASKETYPPIGDDHHVGTQVLAKTDKQQGNDQQLYRKALIGRAQYVCENWPAIHEGNEFTPVKSECLIQP